METRQLWDIYYEPLYFFALKKVQNKDTACEIVQNTFLKVHSHLHTLKNPKKVKAWLFQITRNEIANHFNGLLTDSIPANDDTPDILDPHCQNICCFDRFVDGLPDIYREVIKMVYRDGKKQKEVAQIAGMSLPNVKARIARGKALLKKNFTECCRFQLDKNGMLIGEPDCAYCHM